MPFRRFYSLVVGSSIALVPLLLLAQFPTRHAGPMFVRKSPEDAALISRIQALSPSVSLDDAKKVAYCAVTTGHDQARLWNVKRLAKMMPGLQDWLVRR